MTLLKCRKALNNISSFMPENHSEEIVKELGADKIIRLSANENTMGCSPLVQKSIQQSEKLLNFYPDIFCMELRNRLSELFHIKNEQLIFGNGSFELLSLIAQAFINSGEESIIPEPSFGWYKVATLSMNGVVINVPLENHAINLNDIKNKITDKTKIIWLCNPNNPTGTIFGEKQLAKFLFEIPSNIMVVLDEAYNEFATNKEYPDSIRLINKYPNIIVLRTFSKVYGLASLRIGYGIANSQIINYLNKIRLPANVNVVAQIAALASLKDQNFKKACIENNIIGKEYFYKCFNDMKLEYIPTETNFIMVNVLKDSIDVSNEILKRGIAVRAGTEFGMPTWLRITIGRPEENKLVIESLKEVLNSIQYNNSGL